MTARPIARQHNEFYGARPIKRERRTKDRVAQLDRQILDVLTADHPQSVRHVYYRMTDPRLPEPVKKTDKGYKAVQRRCVELRREGRLPYNWLSDTGRRGYFVDTFSGASDFVSRMAGLYRADLWEQADYRCEVWCESRSIAGVIQADCEELAVSLYAAGGFSSITFAFEAARTMNNEDDGREVVIFYIGDYDPAGVLIDVALERELRRHLDPDVRMRFERIGITREQVERYDLPTKPRKKSDRRSLHVEYAVEAEAMPAGILRRLLRDHIEELLPPRALEIAKIAEDRERAHLEWMANAFDTDSFDAEEGGSV